LSGHQKLIERPLLQQEAELMKRLLTFLVLAALLAPSVLCADIPQYISYQGVLRDAGGVPIPDGDYAVTFCIYVDETGGVPVWCEGQTLTVTGGIINASLGSVTPLGWLPFDVPHWLGIAVDGEPELSPRTEFTAAPYAFRAEVANTCTQSDDDWQISGDDISHETGNVGIGTATPAVSLDVVAGDTTAASFENLSYDNGFAVRALNSVGTAGGFFTGVPPTSHPLEPSAVYGRAGDNSTGGYFSSSDGMGLYAESSTGVAVGGYSTDGYAGYFDGALGVFVDHLLETRRFKMQLGAADGYVMTSDGSGVGTWQPAGTGADSDWTISGSDMYSGVSGRVGIGVSTPAAKLEVLNDSASDIPAVRGESVPLDGYGTGGEFKGGYCGIRGVAQPTGHLDYYGLQATVSGGSGTNYAVYGSALGTGTNWAGYFAGDVDVLGVLYGGSPVFKVDHPLDPEGKYLVHAGVESDEMLNVYSGSATLDARGEATVDMPDWFEAFNQDLRYQLTCIGGFAPVYIAEEISDGRFTIAGGEPAMKVSWMVTGTRRDRFSEENRIVVEEEKPPREAGKYLHPELYGRSKEDGIGYLDPGLDEEGR
jgi:hypothetical protein